MSISLRCLENPKTPQTAEAKKNQINHKSRKTYGTEATKSKTKEKTDEEFHSTFCMMLKDLRLHGAKDELKVKFVERANMLIANILRDADGPEVTWC